MARPKPKTVLRSIRIPSRLEDVLRADAEARGLSVNALVSSILTRYAEWDRFADKFGFVTITRNGFRALVEGLDDEGRERVGRETGSQNPREMTLFWYKKLGLDAFLDYLSLIRRYAKWSEFEVQRDERRVTIQMQHHWGPKASNFQRFFMEEAVRGIVGVVPECEVGRDSVLLRFTPPER